MTLISYKERKGDMIPLLNSIKKLGGNYKFLATYEKWIDLHYVGGRLLDRMTICEVELPEGFPNAGTQWVLMDTAYQFACEMQSDKKIITDWLSKNDWKLLQDDDDDDEDEEDE